MFACFCVIVICNFCWEFVSSAKVEERREKFKWLSQWEIVSQGENSQMLNVNEIVRKEDVILEIKLNTLR